MALDWGADNIQVNLLAPSWTYSEMTVGVWENKERTAYIIDETPAGRSGFNRVAGSYTLPVFGRKIIKGQ